MSSNLDKHTEHQHHSQNDDDRVTTSCCSTKQTSCCTNNALDHTEHTQVISPEHKKDLTKNLSKDSNTDHALHDGHDHEVGQKDQIEASYYITGMDCPSCAQTISKKLNQFKDISDYEVDFNSGKMALTFNHNETLAQVEKAIKQLGFNLSLIQKSSDYTNGATHEDLNRTSAEEYQVEGMDCSSCALTIEKHLKQINDVTYAEVNFSTGKLMIEHHLTPQEIIDEVKKVGYDATPIVNGQVDLIAAPKFWQGMSHVIISGVSLLIGMGVLYLTQYALLANIFFAIAIVAGGHKAFRSAWYAIQSKSLDMNVLMSAAAIGAVLINQWVEGASVVFLFSLGTTLQTKTIEKTRASIRNLMQLAPETAWVKEHDRWVEKSVKSVTVNQQVLVKPAERIPLDGVIQQGLSSVNQAPITGESMPVDKAVGDTVFAGSINGNGTLEIVVTQTTNHTALARIIHLVEKAQSKKSATQSFIERFAEIYTPVVFVLAILTILVPPLLFSAAWDVWFYRGLELLVVACPCALVISTPVAIVSAIGNAAQNGILLKGGMSLEKLATINSMVFDKTGTLTEGKPVVTGYDQFSTLDSARLFNIIYTIENHSNHPLARAITLYAKEKDALLLEATEYQALPGKGASALIDGQVWYAGNAKLFYDLSGQIDATVKKEIDRLENQGATLVILGNAQNIYAIFAIADQLRATSQQTIEKLKTLGVVKTQMLTGDNAGIAANIAATLNVDYQANLMPEDKVTAIEKLQQQGYQVAMVGDGINDAPALTQANVGISMGGAGTDSAIEVSDIVLMSDNIEKLPHAVQLGQKTKAIIKQNIIFSIAVKLIALVLIFPGWLTLWLAILSDTGAAILVILNSLRLLALKDKE